MSFLEQCNTGLPQLKIANLFKDIKILNHVQKVALDLLKEDPKLEKEENLLLSNKIKDKFKTRLEL